MYCVGDCVCHNHDNHDLPNTSEISYNKVDRVGFEPTTPYVSSTVIGMQGRYSTGLNYRPTLN